MVSRSTLRGVLGCGGSRSALAAGMAETAAVALTATGAAEGAADGAGRAASVLHEIISSAAHEIAEMQGNWLSNRDNELLRKPTERGRPAAAPARTVETRPAFVEVLRAVTVPLW